MLFHSVLRKKKKNHTQCCLDWNARTVLRKNPMNYSRRDAMRQDTAIQVQEILRRLQRGIARRIRVMITALMFPQDKRSLIGRIVKIRVECGDLQVWRKRSIQLDMILMRRIYILKRQSNERKRDISYYFYSI